MPYAGWFDRRRTIIPQAGDRVQLAKRTGRRGY
jgi:hypothetical protein